MGVTRSLSESRREFLGQENVVGVTLTTGQRYVVVKGSYTDEADRAVKGPGGQVTFITPVTDHIVASERLVLTYTHFIVALEYYVPSEDS
jgi:hypothetical protein